jgi:pSer/pThr/pTyr-binding forkhead associated (FHA) protein
MSIDVAAAGTVLGRSSECDVRLEDPNASRQHARISAVDGDWKLEDLGSTNGVLVNGARVAGSTPLRSGDRIQLGHTDLTFETI